MKDKKKWIIGISACVLLMVSVFFVFNQGKSNEQVVTEYFELLKKKNFTDWMSEGERNLDSELISSFSDEIMPTDKRFYSYIITITGHGQYSYRKSLKPYYEKLSEYGLKIDSTKDLSDLDNSFITYVATTLEVDKMIGTLY